jgi:hypothetical protein
MTPRRAARPTIVILGEDDNDRRSIQILVAGLRPDLERGILKPLRKPMALVRNVPPARLPSQAVRAAAVLRAVDAAAPIRCVLMHEDADDVEPAHEHLIRKIESAYRSWQCPDQYAGRDVGRIRNAKEALRRAVKPAGAKATFLGYTEADSVAIAAKIVELGLLAPPWHARSASWAAFVEQVKRL